MITACTILKSPILVTASQLQDGYIRRCTALQSISPNLDFFSLSPTHTKQIPGNFAAKLQKFYQTEKRNQKLPDIFYTLLNFSCESAKYVFANLNFLCV